MSDPYANPEPGEITALKVVVVILSAVLVYALAGLARGAEPEVDDCELTYVLDVGQTEKCEGHVSVSGDFLAKLLREESELEKAQAALAAAQEREVIRAERDAALLSSCEGTLKACEASRIPPRCDEPGTWARPEVAWPVGLGLGFVLGFATDHWGVK